jgi:DNA-binding MarR family transcriptional regulator
VLRVLAGEPGLNNGQVARRAGVKDPGHISRLLGRLARQGLIEDTPAPGLRRGVRAWRLTVSGRQLHVGIAREARVVAGVLCDLPEEFAGRLDFWAVCVLRAVGEQPWLSSSEAAARAGVKDPAQMPGLLGLLAGLGLLEGVREAHRRGSPKVWQLTSRGRELEATIARKAPTPTPVPVRSVALDLMRQTGGRLSESAVAVLAAIAGEPGLSNREIALRVGIADANSASQLLARLTRRGLIENTRNGGRENAWALTTAGTTLQHAIHHDASTPSASTVATELLNARGARLNHRVLSLLNTIAIEPGLSNTEIAERLAINSKAHTSRLLTRLAHHGLIENHTPHTTPFTPNTWQLTTTGKQLHTTIRNHTPTPNPTTPHNHHPTQPPTERKSVKARSSQGLRRITTTEEEQ